MARKPRFNLPGIPQHVIQRGNNREPCFYAPDDYYRYLQDLEEAAKKYQCAIHAYVLMTNHVHLLVTPFVEHGVSHMMQDIGRKYVRYINHVYKRSGTLWEGRYKASLVDSQIYLFTCMRYIELNPVRASMVNHPGEYQWSSYSFNATGKANSLITKHVLYAGLGDTEYEQQISYRKLFRNHLDKDEVHSIRKALNQELVVGRDEFKEKIEQMTNRQVKPAPMGRPRIEEGSAMYIVLWYISDNCALTPLITSRRCQFQNNIYVMIVKSRDPTYYHWTLKATVYGDSTLVKIFVQVYK